MNVCEIKNEKIDLNIKEDEKEINYENQINSPINSPILKEITPEMKHNFINKVETLSRNEHIQILRMMKSLNINITENFNGSFINISKISDMDFIQLDNYVEISYKNNIENEERLKEIERLSNEVNSQLDNNNNTINNFNNNLNTKSQNISNELGNDYEDYDEYNEKDTMKDKNLNEIKNNKNLNSLEKAIMRQNLANNSIDSVNEPKNFNLESYKNSQKYTGVRAKLLKTCKEITKNDSFINTVTEDKRKKKKEVVVVKETETIEKI